MPVALAGIIGMAFVALNAGVAGVAYSYLVRREAFVQGSPLRAPTRTQFVVFLEIALLWATVVASSYRKIEWSLMVTMAAFAVPALTALILESLRLCNRLLPTTGWAWWTVVRAAVGAVAATFSFTLPMYAAGVFGGIAATEQPKSFLPREAWFGFFVFFALLTNYITSLGRRWRVAFLAMYSVGTLALFAPSAIAELPFRALRLADFNATLLPADTRAEAFRNIHAECGTEPQLRADNALIVHVRSSVGSDYIVDCTKREWVRIPKGQVAAELAPLKPSASAVPIIPRLAAR